MFVLQNLLSGAVLLGLALLSYLLHRATFLPLHYSPSPGPQQLPVLRMLTHLGKRHSLLGLCLNPRWKEGLGLQLAIAAATSINLLRSDWLNIYFAPVAGWLLCLAYQLADLHRCTSAVKTAATSLAVLCFFISGLTLLGSKLVVGGQFWMNLGISLALDQVVGRLIGFLLTSFVAGRLGEQKVEQLGEFVRHHQEMRGETSTGEDKGINATVQMLEERPKFVLEEVDLNLVQRHELRHTPLKPCRAQQMGTDSPIRSVARSPSPGKSRYNKENEEQGYGLSTLFQLQEVEKGESSPLKVRRESNDNFNTRDVLRVIENRMITELESVALEPLPEHEEQEQQQYGRQVQEAPPGYYGYEEQLSGQEEEVEDAGVTEELDEDIEELGFGLDHKYFGTNTVNIITNCKSMVKPQPDFDLGKLVSPSGDSIGIKQQPTRPKAGSHQDILRQKRPVRRAFRQENKRDVRQLLMGPSPYLENLPGMLKTEEEKRKKKQDRRREGSRGSARRKADLSIQEL